jgi:hypothetical protein
MCGRPDRPTKHYQVRLGEERYGWDLCDEDASGLRQLVDSMPKNKRNLPQQSRRPSRREADRVMTMEEIEEFKRKGES